VTEKRDKEEGAVLTKVLEIRIRQPKCGGKKIHRHISARYDWEIMGCWSRKGSDM
jgi:hypothetical protein